MNLAAKLAVPILLSFAGALSAQYTRTETTATYVQRTGTSIAGQELYVSGIDDSALLVQLPFDFQYFDRVYRSCWISSNGRVCFNTDNATTFSAPPNLTPSVGSNYTDTIFAIGGDLYARTEGIYSTLGAYSESGRVVLQWTNVSFFSGMRCSYLNFQVHLLSNGNVEMHYGPENVIPNYSHNIPFASGMVNFDGSASVFGFGNTTSQQTTRPVANTLVTLALTASPANTVTINQNPMPLRRFVPAPATDLPVLSFKLVRSGMGAMVTELDFNHADFAGDGNPVTLKLVKDTGTIGSYDGEAAIGALATMGGNTSVTGLTEDLTSVASANYLLVASYATLSVVSQSGFYCGSGMPASMTGSAISNRIALAPQGMAWFAGSIPNSIRPAATVGSTHQRLMTFSIQQDADSPSYSLTQMSFGLTLTGVTLADIDQLQLWRDAGTPGEWDASDTLISTVTSVSTTNLFTGLSEATTKSGTAYIVTADISASLAASGTLKLTYNLPSSGTPFPTGSSTGELLQVAGPGSTLIVRDVPDYALTSVTAAVSEIGVHANVFELIAGSGSGTVTQIDFSETQSSNSQVTDARLYQDTGTSPGRYDTGDTPIPATVTLGAATISMSLTTPLTVTGVAKRFVLVVDIASNASNDMRFDVGGMSITSNFVNQTGASTGTFLDQRAGSANGVNLSAALLTTSANIYTNKLVILGQARCQARGTGGAAPTLHFVLGDNPCGRGANCRIFFQVWLEGAGPLGALDATDVECHGFYSTNGSVQFQLGSTPFVPAGVTRDFLIVARHIAAPGVDIGGPFDVHFGGYSAGTDTAWFPAGTPAPAAATLINTRKSSNPGGGGGSDGGCTTGQDGKNWLAWLAVLAAAAAVTRLRRARS